MTRRHRRISPNKIIDAPRSTVSTKRLGRRVRVSIIMKPELYFDGKQNEATYAYADLDEEQVDVFVRRLTAIRGGKRSIA